jgi:hypothetical protein
MRRLLLILFFLAAAPLLAHPAVSVVIDARGNIFYSDLERVWMQLPNGTRQVAVPNVHTHELAIDAAGNVYGEHLWYEGDATKKWGHYVWRRAPNGRIDKVIPPTEGFLEHDNYSFVRDAAAAMYWVDREHNAVKKRLPDGRVVVVARHVFEDARWMTVTPDGDAYIVDFHDLLRVSRDGHLSVVARNLSSLGGGRHAIMGLWTDRAGNVYLAVTADHAIKRVTPDGKVSTVLRGTSATGGTFAPNGDLWLLENDRVRKVKLL